MEDPRDAALKALTLVCGLQQALINDLVAQGSLAYSPSVTEAQAEIKLLLTHVHAMLSGSPAAEPAEPPPSPPSRPPAIADATTPARSLRERLRGQP